MSSDRTSSPPGGAGRVTLRFESMRELIARLAPWLGPDGVFVASESPLPEGSQVDFELKVRDQLKLLHGTAQVAWVRREPSEEAEPAGMALRFLEIDSAGSRFVERLVENHRQGGGTPFDVAASRPPGSRLAELTEVVPSRPPAPAAPAPTEPAVGDDEPLPEAPPAAPTGIEGRGEGAAPPLAAAPPAEAAADEPEPAPLEVPFATASRPRQEAFPPSFLDEVEAEIRSAPSPPAGPPIEEEPQAELELGAPLEIEDLEPDVGDVQDEELTLEVDLPEDAEEPEEWLGAAPAPESADEPEPEAVELEPEAVDLEPEAADLEPEAVDLEPEAVDLEPEPPDLEPEAVEDAVLEAAETLTEAEEPGATAPPEEPAPARSRGADLLSLPDLPPVAPVIERAPAASEPPSSLRAESMAPPDDLPPVEMPEITPGAQFAEARGARRTWAVLLFSLLTVGVLAALFLLGDRLLGIWRQASVDSVATEVVEEPAGPVEARPGPPPAETPAVEGSAPAPGPPAAEPEAPASGPAADAPAAAAPTGGAPPAAPRAAPAPDDGLAAATRIEGIAWEERGGATVVTIEGDVPIRPRDLQSFRLDGDNPRQVIKIAGIQQELARRERTVGTPQIARIRSALHELPEGSELHLVFDLADPRVQLERQVPSPSGLRLVFRTGESG